MASDGFDIQELDNYTRNLLNLAEKKMPKESRKFLIKEAAKLRVKTRAKANSTIRKKTGNYMKGFKRGKVYKYQGKELAVRVYNSSPHAHLIEHGHRQYNSRGAETGFTPGKHILEEATKEFQNTFYDDCENFIDDMLGKGL